MTPGQHAALSDMYTLLLALLSQLNSWIPLEINHLCH